MASLILSQSADMVGMCRAEITTRFAIISHLINVIWVVKWACVLPVPPPQDACQWRYL